MKRSQIARIKKRELKQEIVDFFHENPRASFNYKQVSAALGITRQMSKLMVEDILYELLQQHYLREEREGKYCLAIRPAKERKVLGDDIMTEFELPEKYPEEAEKEAMEFSEEISPEEFEYREDFRQVPTFTIDPLNAKDYDDALSLQKLPNGHWEVGVHIADVTYYVKPKSIIDVEAEKRATSVYLVDRTIPMLPEQLCNRVCSLRPDEDKRCFACIFEIDDKAKVLSYRIKRSLIRSDKRMTYEEAQDVIDGKSEVMKTEILTLHHLAQILRENRIKNGAIRFESSEVYFTLDENGKPLSVSFKESTPSHNLIEEFMLLANRTVAEFIGGTGTLPKTFVYRVHDVPNKEKLADVAKFIKRFGCTLNTEGSKKEVAKSINQLLDNVHGRKEENLISTITIRAMAKAIYSTDNIGHYGLAFRYYTHFTSPIRRYPDMMVHRLLERYLSGGKSVSKDLWEKECEHCSDMEQFATQAERASVKCKQIEFMSERMGIVYDAVISGVTEFGIFVEIVENKCEGLITMRDLDDDHYEYDEKNYRLIGRRFKKTYQLGDPVKIMVAKANMERRQLDFVLAPDPEKK